MDEVTPEECEAAMELASREAWKRVRYAVPMAEVDADDRVLEEIRRHGWVCIDYDDEQVVYLSAEGYRQVEGWLQRGKDASGEPLTPEWRARLRPRMG